MYHTSSESYLKFVFVKQQEVKFGEGSREGREGNAAIVFFEVGQERSISCDLVSWVLRAEHEVSMVAWGIKERKKRKREEMRIRMKL